MTGKEFRKWRRINDFTQEEIATTCNINKSIISRWENDLVVITEKNYKSLLEYRNQNTANESHE